MNKNTKQKKKLNPTTKQPRKSPDNKPKVGYPNKPDSLRGPSIRDQMEMCGQLPKN